MVKQISAAEVIICVYKTNTTCDSYKFRRCKQYVSFIVLFALSRVGSKATNFVYFERIYDVLMYINSVSTPTHVISLGTLRIRCLCLCVSSTVVNREATDEAHRKRYDAKISPLSYRKTFNNNRICWQTSSVRQEHIIFYYLLNCFWSVFQCKYITLNYYYCCRCRCECDAMAQTAVGNSWCEYRTCLFKIFMMLCDMPCLRTNYTHIQSVHVRLTRVSRAQCQSNRKIEIFFGRRRKRLQKYNKKILLVSTVCRSCDVQLLMKMYANIILVSYVAFGNAMLPTPSILFLEAHILSFYR